MSDTFNPANLDGLMASGETSFTDLLNNDAIDGLDFVDWDAHYPPSELPSFGMDVDSSDLLPIGGFVDFQPGATGPAPAEIPLPMVGNLVDVQPAGVDDILPTR
jgi:hypothetical protein